MITPEPSALPRAIVTLTCTTVGRIFAMTASRIASILLPVKGGIVGCGLVPGCKVATLELGVTEAVFPLPNSKPAANTTIPKSNASSIVSTTALPVRGPLVGGIGVFGGVSIGWYDAVGSLCISG